MPWGDDDVLGIRLLTFSCSVFAIGFRTVMHALGIYPITYYVLVDPNELATDSRQINYIFPGLVAILVITAIIIGIVTKVHDAANVDHFEAILYSTNELFPLDNSSNLHSLFTSFVFNSIHLSAV
jgi:hypothetical protein